MSLVKKYSKDTHIWLMSDLHLNHDKQFIWGTRGFASVQEHNETLIKNIKECVKEDDEFYILGDLTLGPLEEAEELLRQLPGHIHVILGNHDTDRRIEFYQSLGWEVQFATLIRWDKQTFYLSHYPTNTGNADKQIWTSIINCCGHTHSCIAWNPHTLPLSYNVAPEANFNRPVAIGDILATIIAGNIFNKCEESSPEALQASLDNY